MSAKESNRMTLPTGGGSEEGGGGRPSLRNSNKRQPSASSSSSFSLLPSSSNNRLLEEHWGKHYNNRRSSAPTSSTSNSSSSNGSTSGRAVWAGRILFICVLVTLAFSLGALAFKLLTEDEENLAETQFRSISERALIQAKEGLLSRRWAAATLSNVVAELYPNLDEWPFVAWYGFETVVNDLLKTSRGRDMGFIPFVDPSDLSQFETFAQDVYQTLGFPNTTGIYGDIENNDFGVWARDTSVTPVQKFHDVNATTPYGSPYNILTPIFRTDEGYHPVLMFNPHSQRFTGEAIDQLLECSYDRQAEYEKKHGTTTTTTTLILDENETLVEGEEPNSTPIPEMPPHQCGVISDIFWNVKLGGRWSVANFLPIYPHRDPLNVVGYISSIFIVDELLENVFATEITGVDAVFETDAMSVSYTIINGKAVFTGEGKLYDSKYEKLQETIQLADPSLFTTGKNQKPPKFIFTLTPNDDFYEVYHTQGPLVASVVVICSILLTILVFFLYDFFVRREFHAKRELLEARRQFMRFVSHEVRTPLNAVSMGLDLMQSEVAQALGYDSTTCLQASIQQQEEEDETELGTNSTTSDNSTMNTTDNSREQDSNPQTLAGNANKMMIVKQKFPTSQRKDNNNNVVIPPQEARQWFHLSQEIQSNAQGAVDILNDLLNYDKIEQGTLQLGLEVLCVWELLEKAILEFKLPASSKHIRLRVGFGVEQQDEEEIGGSQEQHRQQQDKKMDEELSPIFPRARDLPDEIRDLRVIGDSVRLTQVLRNLMSNALKFTPANGSVNVEAIYHPETPGVEQIIELQKGQLAKGYQKGRIKVRVTDTGAGMSPDQVAKLFQDGVQFNANELQAGGGSGLGLYIAKGIVKQHDGYLTASSDGIGHGTTFETVLPLWKVSTGDADCCGVFVPHRPDKTKVRRHNKAGETNPASLEDETHKTDFGHSASSIEPPPTATVGRPLKVLVVDDVMSNRKLLIRLLENNGHSCDQAENGQAAVELVKSASSLGVPYDSVLLDYEMPVMDGPTAAKVIRHKISDEVNIVGITGNVLPEDVSFFRSCGANDVLAKPVKMPDLIASWTENGVGGATHG